MSPAPPSPTIDMPSSVTALGQARSSGPRMAPSACCCSPAAVQRRLPILAWLPSYSLQWLKMDFVAGLSVGLTAIPQALAYAEVAGLPPQGSCWTSFPAPSLKASPLLLPSPSALDRSRTCWDYRTSPGSSSCRCTTPSSGSQRPGDAILGLVCMLLLLVLKLMRDHMPPIHPEMPPGVRLSHGLVWAATTARNALVVSFAALVAYSFEVTGYQPFILTGETAEGLPPVRIPPFSVTTANGTISFTEMVQDMGAGLAVVPLMGLLESIAVAKAFASQNNYRIDANQELLAIGLTNMLGSLVSSYPVTGSFGRTAVNAQSGVCTPAGGLVTGVLVLLSLDYLTSLFYYIPKSALAAVIIMAVAPLFDTKIFRTLWRVKRLDLLPLCVTFLLCFWEVQYGILAGALVSLLMLLHAAARPETKVSEGPVLVLQPASGLSFPAVEALREEILSRALAVSPPRCLVLECTHVCSIDYTVVLGLGELLQDFQKEGVTLAFVGLQVPVLRVLLSADLKGFQYFSTLEEAEKHLRQEPGTQPYNIREDSVPDHKVALLKA
nr:sodium-independent sulfate anion transporter isoform X3 [Symphalangus syndactylus]